MGVEYYVADHKNKLVFELGKGALYQVFDAEIRETIMDHNGMFLACMDAWCTWGYDLEGWTVPYLYTVSLRLHTFCENAGWDVSVLNDCDDSWWEARERGYVQVDSRYEEG